MGRIIRRTEIEDSEVRVTPMGGDLALATQEPAVADTPVAPRAEIVPEPGDDEQVERVRKLVQAMLSGFARQRRELLADLQPYVVRISVEIARRILRRELRTDPGMITRIAESALEQVAVRRRAAELFNLETATRLLEEIERDHPAVLRAAREAGLTAALLRQVGGRLLECRLPMRDPLAVIEALVECLAETTDPETLAFACRPRLAGMISAGVAPRGRVRALELAPELQQELVDCVHRSETGTVAALPPERLAVWVDTLDDLGREYAWGQALVVICEPRGLPALAHLCTRTSSELIALTSSDLTPTVTVEFVARLTPDLLA